MAISTVKPDTTTTTTEVFLTPRRMAAMLRERRAFQVVKFRTNCTDCVPNL